MLIVQLFELLVVSSILIGLISIVVKGAPYAVTSQKRVNTLVGLLRVKKNERAIDLGSGDGRIVIALARAGAIADGYEINPLLVLLSRRKIKQAGLQSQAKIYWKSFWHADFSLYTVVTKIGSPHIMRAVGNKLENELQTGARVGSVTFIFPGWEKKNEKERAILYIR